MDDDSALYKDISELKKELEGMKGRKDVSTKDIYDAVQKLTQTMKDILEVFGAAAEQMKLEEKEYESEQKKHEVIMSRLDKLIDQNKTIAEGMVAIVDMVKERMPAKDEEQMFMPRPEPRPFMKPVQQEWMPKPGPMTPRQGTMMPLAQPMQPPISAAMPPELGMPPMQPTPAPDLDFPENELKFEEPKKKGLFGVFKK